MRPIFSRSKIFARSAQWALAAGALLCAACAADDSRRGGGGADGGGPSSPSSPSDPSKPAPPTTGNVTMVEIGGPFPNSLVDARFLRETGLPDPSCTTATAGACKLTACARVTSFPPDYSVTYEGGGTVTVRGLAADATLTPGADSKYAEFYGPPSLWSGGETIAIATTGGDVPAFQASLTAPSPAVLTAPVFTATSTLGIDRGADLTLAWTGGAFGDLELTIASIGDQSTATLDCRLPQTQHSLTVPSSLLAQLAPGQAHFDVQTIADTLDTAGDFAITSSAIATALNADGSAASTLAMVK